MPASASLDAKTLAMSLSRSDPDTSRQCGAPALSRVTAWPTRDSLNADVGFGSSASLHQRSDALADKSGRNPWNSLLVESLATAFAAHTIHCLAAARPEPAVADVWLRRVLSYIDAHPDRKLTLNELAAAACLSRYHLSHRFKQVMGVGPCRYTLLRRIEHAKILLWRGDAPIALIAAEVGFADQSRFAATFRKETGFTPRQFRAASRLEGSWPAKARR